MELVEIIQFLLATIIAGGGYWLSRLASDVKQLERNMVSCQIDLNQKFVMKDDYHEDLKDFKDEMREQSKKIDQIWKTLRQEK
mgnify:CR=1 FL=1